MKNKYLGVHPDFFRTNPTHIGNPLCLGCSYVFENKRESNSQLKKLWIDYVDGKQTYQQLSDKHGWSKRWTQKLIDRYVGWSVEAIVPIENDNKVVVGMDSSYWKRSLGVMVFRDLYRQQNLSASGG